MSWGAAVAELAKLGQMLVRALTPKPKTPEVANPVDVAIAVSSYGRAKQSSEAAKLIDTKYRDYRPEPVRCQGQHCPPVPLATRKFRGIALCDDCIDKCNKLLDRTHGPR